MSTKKSEKLKDVKVEEKKEKSTYKKSSKTSIKTTKSSTKKSSSKSTKSTKKPEGKITFLNVEKRKSIRAKEKLENKLVGKFSDVQSTESMVYALKSYRKRVRLATMDQAIDYFTNLKIPGWKSTVKGLMIEFIRPKVGMVVVTFTSKEDTVFTSYKEYQIVMKTGK